MIKYSDIINRLTRKPTATKVPKVNNLNRAGYGYMKRRLGLLSNEINELLEVQRASAPSKNN